MFIIIWLIVLIIILLTIYKTKIIEGYDARYTDTTFSKCAEFCKTTAGCYGFGYNKNKKICYPSALPIFGFPLDSIFNSEYSYNNTTCNKTGAVETSNKKPAFEERRSNAVYICTETEGKQPQYYFHNKNTFNNMGEGKNIDKIFDVEVYEVRDFKWPRNRFDYDQKDLLIKEKESQTFVPNNITDLDRIMKFQPIKTEEPTIIKPKIIVEPKYDFGLDETAYNIMTNAKNLIPNFNFFSF